MSAENDPGHGNSPAAWTAVIIILIAFVLGTIAFWLESPVFVAVCGGLVVVGLLVGFVLSKMGYGVKGPRWQSKGHAAGSGQH